jgi:hypothetical protein
LSSCPKDSYGELPDESGQVIETLCEAFKQVLHFDYAQYKLTQDDNYIYDTASFDRITLPFLMILKKV